MIIREKVMRMNTTYIKSYSELTQIPTFIERYRYLKLDGRVCDETFGCNRILNQILYRSSEWRRFRRNMIVRDNACDLACDGYDIADGSSIILHHINPITVEDVKDRNPMIFDPENVVCTILNTHNAIHYGDENILMTDPLIRTPNDTCPWKR